MLESRLIVIAEIFTSPDLLDECDHPNPYQLKIVTSTSIVVSKAPRIRKDHIMWRYQTVDNE